MGGGGKGVKVQNNEVKHAGGRESFSTDKILMKQIRKTHSKIFCIC